MSDRHARSRLFADYAALDRENLRWPTDDQRRSLVFYQKETELRNDSPPMRNRSRVSVWVRTVTALDAFVEREGRLPRENNRKPRESISDEERRLADWLRYQRRAASVALMCDFQKRRLESVPGFLWDPRSDHWETMFSEFATFVATHHRAPRYRSEDSHERALATWAVKQRRQIRSDTLPGRRLRKLKGLSINFDG